LPKMATEKWQQKTHPNSIEWVMELVA